MLEISDSFKATIEGVHGKRGSEWLQQLPTLISYCEEKWSIKILQPYDLSYNYVAPAITDAGEHYVIKLRVPDKEFKDEVNFLRFYKGDGIVRLMAEDIEKGIILMEQLSPGKSLKFVENDQESVAIAANAISSLWRPVPSGQDFPHVRDLAEGLNGIRKKFNGGTGPFDRNLVGLAEKWFPKLIASTEQEVLLHGDFHHENILLNENDWIIIDPKGLIGEADYDITNFLRNHLLHFSNPKEILYNRINLFAKKLDLNKERILKWGLCQAVLSAWWFLEDNLEGWEEDMRVAQLYLELLEE
ncbi:aminoglycoside phosphotransferase family protein [Cytobacillus purgationiresistens]|uniref:Streptomycin 6-kinase n=1 Tax=Cytobacillus purgationiresistens TaxID=863449 RepID=A0ABU0AGX5_9BACI|nr:aminoglycoside phosphotransferase family protein [Cytobacillus purgationiresistens]MDQ0270511.1 streptomycin 6-kinase [Cytobacillus purgationiresistens]